MTTKHMDALALAERWQKPPSWVYSNWKRLGIPAIRIGQSLRFALMDIERWEEEHRA
jgi:hypothetical protein